MDTGSLTELVDRLYAQSEVSHGEGWDEVAKLDSDAAKVIESLSAQVAALTERLRDIAGHATSNFSDAVDWRERADAAEAQVAELKKDAERYLFIKDDRRGSLVESLSFMDAENWNAVIDAAKESE